MQNPPTVESGHRRAMSDDCDAIIHDVEDGVVIVIENRDKIMYTMRFDFGASTNLKMIPDAKVEKVDELKCNIEVQPGTVRNLCHLQIADTENMDHFDMRYRVQCLIRNAKGELEQVKPPAPKASGGGGEGKEERKKITDTLYVIFQQLPDGYVVFFESSDADLYRCVLDISGSSNLELMTGPGTKAVSAESCSFEVAANSRVAVAKLALSDPSKGSCSLSYRVKHDKDSSAREAAEAAAKKKAEDDAAAKKAAEAEAKRKADEDARKKAEADAEAKRKADEDARKKAEADAEAKRKAEADAAAKKAADEAAAAAAKKAAEELAARQAAEAEARRKAEAEWRLKMEAEFRAKFELLFEEEVRFRERVAVEERGKYILLQREYRHSICNLCRGLFRAGQDMLEYKIYKLHQVCYDKAPKCDWCGDILIGEYVVTKGDLGSGTKLHKECIEPYKKKARPVCVGCNQQIMDDQWSSAGGKPYHHACRK